MIIKKNKNLKGASKDSKKQDEKKSPGTGDEKNNDINDFSQPVIRERQERRRGDRRRGYRRTDDRNLISRAQEEANAIKESASREGFEVGLDNCKAEIAELNKAINELLTAKEMVMQNSIPDIAFLAVKAAEKLIKKELQIDENVILGVVSEVIKSISKDESEIKIRTNSNDADIVRQKLPEIYPENENVKITVIPDEEVDWGSCIVETKNGIVDARFTTQLQILQKALEAGL